MISLAGVETFLSTYECHQVSRIKTLVVSARFSNAQNHANCNARETLSRVDVEFDLFGLESMSSDESPSDCYSEARDLIRELESGMPTEAA